MEVVIVGGDARFGALARLLAERGDRVWTLGREPSLGIEAADRDALSRAECVVVNQPPSLNVGGSDLEALWRDVSPRARWFFCGPGHPDPLGENGADLWTDEALQRENARLTAEGAIFAAMGASDCALRDMPCLVIGWGRIGKALTELLIGLGARVTVASRSEAGRNRAASLGAEAVETWRVAGSLPGQRLVFNTAPSMVLDGEALAHADGNAMLIDLASPPFGIDLRAARDRGLRAWREPGLPGRYCPESAAQALLRAMDRRDRL